jgi:SRSO17 transposase
VAVTLSIANRHASLPIAYQLYLPKAWAEDAARRNEAHVPEAIRFRTKPQIALAQIKLVSSAAATAAGKIAGGAPPRITTLTRSARCSCIAPWEG